MQTKIENRQRLWEVMSEFYLDTELQNYDYRSIVEVLLESNKSIEELIEIDKYEVFPVLKYNLINVSGVWTAFDMNWLFDECAKNHHQKNKLYFRIKVKINMLFIRYNNKEHWEIIKRMINKDEQ